ncbi:hypothetical protein RC52_17315 [Herbaspirillum rubrisubalbicans]|nr:hypothetical protein [Herbaspirillum rubrisubalbicans]
MLILVVVVVEGYGMRPLAPCPRWRCRKRAGMGPECIESRAPQLAQMSNSGRRRKAVLARWAKPIAQGAIAAREI